MNNERINFVPNDILEKDFKIDTRGYRPQEVDKFLDLVIQDYEEFDKIGQEKDSVIQQLTEDNIRLKQEIRALKTQWDVIKDNKNSELNNVDLLRRISNLEKIIYGKEE